jgi:hypothetical protein
MRSDRGRRVDLTPELSAAVALTPWAVEFRYADPSTRPPLDRTKALETVVAVREWATEMIDAKKSTAPQTDSSSEAEIPTVDQ